MSNNLYIYYNRIVATVTGVSYEARNYKQAGQTDGQADGPNRAKIARISPVRDWQSTSTYCQLQSHVTHKLGQKLKIRPEKL